MNLNEKLYNLDEKIRSLDFDLDYDDICYYLNFLLSIFESSNPNNNNNDDDDTEHQIGGIFDSLISKTKEPEMRDILKYYIEPSKEICNDKQQEILNHFEEKLNDELESESFEL